MAKKKKPVNLEKLREKQLKQQEEEIAKLKEQKQRLSQQKKRLRERELPVNKLINSVNEKEKDLKNAKQLKLRYERKLKTITVNRKREIKELKAKTLDKIDDSRSEMGRKGNIPDDMTIEIFDLKKKIKNQNSLIKLKLKDLKKAQKTLDKYYRANA